MNTIKWVGCQPRPGSCFLEEKSMQFLFMALFAAGIVAADQITKYLTVANIA